MKCEFLFLLFIFLIGIDRESVYCLQIVIPDEMAKFNPNPNINQQNSQFQMNDNYQNALKYFQLLNSFNQMNMLGNMNNNMNSNNMNTPQMLLLMQLLSNNNYNTNLPNNMNLLNLIPQATGKIDSPVNIENKKGEMNDKNTTITKTNAEIIIERPKDEVSEILKDEINQLKQLTKEANHIIGGEEKEVSKKNDIFIFEKEVQEEQHNGPVEQDYKENLQINPQVYSDNAEQSSATITDLNFIQTSNSNLNSTLITSKKLSNNLRQEEEDTKQEFEDKFNYLLNKLDVIYQMAK